MNKIIQLISEVSDARQSYLQQIISMPEVQGAWKPSPEAWNAIEVTEHLYWAEHGGILGMWKTLDAIRSGQIERKVESPNLNLSIDSVIQKTWKAKEQVPSVAAPRLGGTLMFWRNALESLQMILESFGKNLQPDELRVQAHPHPISGPLDFHQRLEFLAFHLKRHEGQVSDLVQQFHLQKKS